MAKTDPLAINPGDLRHYVTIEQNAPSRVNGVAQDNWTAVLSAWASFKSLSMKEVTSMGQESSVVTQAVEMRYTPGTAIKAGMRISYRSQYWHIEAAHNVELRNVKWRLLVRNA